MTEWLNVAVSKTVVRESVPRVRIPLSPPQLYDNINESKGGTMSGWEILAVVAIIYLIVNN